MMSEGIQSWNNKEGTMKITVMLLVIFFSLQGVYAEELIIRSKDAQGKEEVIIQEYTPVSERSPREKAPAEVTMEKEKREDKKKQKTESDQAGIRIWCCNSQREKISVEEFLKASGFTILNIGFDPNLATEGCMYRISYRKGKEASRKD
jgi:hypothetical protein